MDTVLLAKLTFAPICVGIAALLGRRFGQRVAGWIVGFPFVAGPILWFFSGEQGLCFGAAAAQSTLLGVVCLAGFCVTYAWASVRLTWPLSLLGGWATFLVLAWGLRSWGPPLWVVVAAASGAAWLGRRALPRAHRVMKALAFPWWELPARMLATAVIVTALTGAARLVGPVLGGLLTPFPVATTVVVVCAQREAGTEGVVRALGGLLASLWSFIAFCMTLAITLVALGRWRAFGVALLANVALQVVVGWRLGFIGRRRTSSASHHPGVAN